MELDRRSFIKGATLTGAATVAAACLPACSANGAQTSDTASSGVTTDYDPETAWANATAVGKHTWEVKPADIPDSEITETKTCEILVIGAGVGGMSAVEAAAQEGADVIIVEQSSGCTAHGSGMGAIGTRLQKQLGDAYTVERDIALRMVYLWGEQSIDFNLLRTWADRSGEVMDHYFDLADEINLGYQFNPCPTAKVDWKSLPYPFRVEPTACTFTDMTWDESEGGVLAQQQFIEMLHKKAESLGAQFLFNTRAIRLLRDGDGPVTGAVCKTEDGFVKINASKGVILATGDISENEEMIDCWCPIDKRVTAPVHLPPNGQLGDGINMGMWVGAAHQKTAACIISHPYYPGCAPLGSFFGCFLIVDKYGNRMGCEVPVEPLITNMQMNAPDKIAWSVWDSDWPSWILKQHPAAGQSMIDTEGPKFDDAIAKGLLLKADTLEDLANQMGVDAKALFATVAKFNANCEAGDDEEFGVPERFLSTIKTAPFYAEIVPSGNGIVPFGLNVDKWSQVCDEDDKPIENLYACGNVQGNFYNFTYPVVCPGLSQGRSVTFGYLLGHAIAQGKTIFDV